MFNIVILEYFICEIGIKNKPCQFFVYVYFFSQIFANQRLVMNLVVGKTI